MLLGFLPRLVEAMVPAQPREPGTAAGSTVLYTESTAVVGGRIFVVTWWFGWRFTCWRCLHSLAETHLTLVVRVLGSNPGAKAAVPPGEPILANYYFREPSVVHFLTWSCPALTPATAPRSTWAQSTSAKSGMTRARKGVVRLQGATFFAMEWSRATRGMVDWYSLLCSSR